MDLLLQDDMQDEVSVFQDIIWCISSKTEYDDWLRFFTCYTWLDFIQALSHYDTSGKRAFFRSIPNDCAKDVQAVLDAAYLVVANGNLFTNVRFEPDYMFSVDKLYNSQVSLECEVAFMDLLFIVDEWSVILLKALSAKNMDVVKYIENNDLPIDRDVIHPVYFIEDAYYNLCPAQIDDSLPVPVSMNTINSTFRDRISRYSFVSNYVERSLIREHELFEWGMLWTFLHRKQYVRILLSPAYSPRLRLPACRIHQIPKELIQLVYLML